MFAPREFPRFGQYFCVNIGKLRLAIPTAPDAASCVLNGFAPICPIRRGPLNVTSPQTSHRAMKIQLLFLLEIAHRVHSWVASTRRRISAWVFPKMPHPGIHVTLSWTAAVSRPSNTPPPTKEDDSSSSKSDSAERFGGQPREDAPPSHGGVSNGGRPNVSNGTGLGPR